MTGTTGAARDWVTIVSGLPRSGTSMMMRMIEAGGIPALTDQLRTPDEDNPNGYYEFEPVKRTRQDPSWLDGARGRVVKMVHLLLPELPTGPGREYRVVMITRDLGEVIASQAKMLARSGKPAVAPEVLKRVYTTQLERVNAWIGSQSGVRSLNIAYDTVIAEPMAQAERVAAFLGLDRAAEMAATVDPALYRNRSAERLA